MGEWTMDVYSIGGLWIDARSDLDLALIASEWERRVPGNCVTIVPAGVCHGGDARENLRWLDERPGFTVVGRGREETWEMRDGEGLEGVEVLPRRGAKRIECLKANGPGIIAISAPSWDLQATGVGEDVLEEWTRLLEGTIAQAKEIKGHDKDALVLVTEHSPVDGMSPTPMTRLLDKHDVKTVVYSGVASSDRWATLYQGRLGQGFQAPDYRFVDADFLSWMPTRVADIDAYSWTRKDRERVPRTELSWSRSPNAAPRPCKALEVTRATSGDWLYRLDEVVAEPASPLAAPTKSPPAIDAVARSRYEAMLRALEGIEGHLTLSRLCERHGVLVERYATELEGVPHSTTTGRLRAEIARLLRGAGSEWTDELLELESGMTVARLREEDAGRYERLRGHFVGYADEDSLDRIVADALGGEAPRRRGLLGTIVKGVVGALGADAAKGAPENTLADAERGILLVEADDVETFSHELAKVVVRHDRLAADATPKSAPPSARPEFGFK